MSELQNPKTFDNGLVVKFRKSAIIFENRDGKEPDVSDFQFEFTDASFQEFIDYMQAAANQAWSQVTPKETNSFGSDYWEYYDKRYDNNGYLTIRNGAISVNAPHGSLDTLYQFNKAKAQAFLFDLLELVEDGDNEMLTEASHTT